MPSVTLVAPFFAASAAKRAFSGARNALIDSPISAMKVVMSMMTFPAFPSIVALDSRSCFARNRFRSRTS